MLVFRGALVLFLGLALNAGLSFSKANAEAPSTHFQFDRLNKTYENVAPKIKEVQSGPLLIRLSSPEHQLTLHSHGIEIRATEDKMYHASLSVEIEGRGKLLAEIDLLGLRQTIEDRFQIPRQKKKVLGIVRVDREAAGYRITPVKIPKSINVIIHSDLGKQLVMWCKALPLALVDCKDLDRVLSKLTLPLPQDKAFFIKDIDLSSKERAVLDQYLGKAQMKPSIK